MNKNLKEIIKYNRNALKSSQKRLCDIFEIMFRCENNILCEYNDGFRKKSETYGEVYKKIEKAAAGLFEKIGATHKYVALAMDNSPEWIVAFWAILKSGNKPYLVNLRYPDTLTNSILKTLDIKYAICSKETTLDTQDILISSIGSEKAVPCDIFEDEIAFSSSATSMNEVICFYTGFEIAEQILNFENIIKLEPRIAKHYKGYLKQLAFLPFYHVFGLFAVYFWFTFFGRTLVFLRDYSADTILKTCRKHAVTHIFAVPVLWHTIEKSVIAAAKEQGEKKYNKLMRGIKFTTALQNIFPSFAPEIAKSIMGEVTEKVFGKSVMFCINGGSYLKDSALKLLNGIGYNTYNGYGMSEIGITSVELGRKPKQRNLNSIGRPFTSVEYKIDDDGVLYVKGSSLCVKKLVNGQAQELNEWFCTGDKMECRDGNYYILGRVGDMVIGENGENINPDSIEKLITVPDAKALSVLGIDTPDGQELSIVIQVNEFISEAKLSKIRSDVYSLNDTLPKATAIKKFYFTTDDLCPPTAVKVSRTQLLKKIKNGEVKLTLFADMKANASSGEASPLTDEVKKIVAEVLGIKNTDFDSNAHIFYDLGATSIQYFSILTKLSEKFAISDYQQNDKYCYTVKDICEYLEKHI
ncbi:MAG: AMP-binding protein [Clostridia bacterium]|nr:AMP-binding protein [Clostridia bacterium]